MRQIILDTETTGLSPAEGHRMIEIAGVELIDRRLTGKTYHQYIRPERKIDAEAIAIHGITENFLTDKPLFTEIAPALLAFLTGAELVIHNAPFDVSFLNHELALAGSDLKPITAYCTIFDTLILARKKHPGQHNNLNALCKRYKVDNSARELHGALMDAHLLTKVYLAMTGGQTSLFELWDTDKQPLTSSPILSDSPANQTNFPLKVIKANSAECSEHQLRLQKIRDENGGISVWEES